MKWQAEHKPHLKDPGSQRARDRARAGIRSQRHQAFLTSAAPGPPTQLAEAKSKQREPLAILTASQADSRTSNVSRHGIRKIITPDDRYPRLFEDQVEATPVIQIPESITQDEMSRLDQEDQRDPQDDEVEASQVEALTQISLPGNETQRDSEIDMLLEESAIGALADASASDVAMNAPSEFIANFIKINVARDRNFTKAWEDYEAGRAESIRPTALESGNSRDEPTPFVFTCKQTPGCKYTSIIPFNIYSHSINCNPHIVEYQRQKENSTVLCLEEG